MYDSQVDVILLLCLSLLFIETSLATPLLPSLPLIFSVFLCFKTPSESLGAHL